MGQENKNPPKKNPLEQGEARKHSPQQGPDVVPRTPPKVEAPRTEPAIQAPHKN